MLPDVHPEEHGLRMDAASDGWIHCDEAAMSPVPAGGTVEVMSGNKVVLQDEDVLQFQSDTAGSLDAILSLLEIT